MKKQILSYLSLGQICDVQSGGTPSRHINAYWEKGNIPWVKISDIKGKHLLGTDEYITRQGLENSSAKIFPKGTILYTIFATLGETTILNIDAATNQAIAGINIHDQYKKIILTDYLYYYLLSIKDIMCKVGRGVAQNNLNLKILRNVQVPVPTIEEQKKIIDTLSSIEKIMLVKDRQLSLLSNLVKSRFLEMFGHSDRPKVRLGECCIINPKKSSDIRLVDNDLMVSFVSMSDVSEDGRIVTCNHKQYESVKSGFTYFSENDVLFAKITPCMENGKGGIAKGLLNGIGFGSTEFHVLRPVDQVSNSCWLYELTSFPQFRQAAEINMTGSAGQRRVPASFLANYKVSLPPISLQNQFADFVHQLDKSKMAIQKSLDELETLKKSLMQTYFG